MEFQLYYNFPILMLFSCCKIKLYWYTEYTFILLTLKDFHSKQTWSIFLSDWQLTSVGKQFRKLSNSDTRKVDKSIAFGHPNSDYSSQP